MCLFFFFVKVYEADLENRKSTENVNAFKLHHYTLCYFYIIARLSHPKTKFTHSCTTVILKITIFFNKNLHLKTHLVLRCLKLKRYTVFAFIVITNENIILYN